PRVKCQITRGADATPLAAVNKMMFFACTLQQARVQEELSLKTPRSTIDARSPPCRRGCRHQFAFMSSAGTETARGRQDLGPGQTQRLHRPDPLARQVV